MKAIIVENCCRESVAGEHHLFMECMIGMLDWIRHKKRPVNSYRPLVSMNAWKSAFYACFSFSTAAFTPAP